MEQPDWPLASLGLTEEEVTAYLDLVRTGPHAEPSVPPQVRAALLDAGLVTVRAGEVDVVPPAEVLHRNARTWQQRADDLRDLAESLAADYRRRPGTGHEAVEVIVGVEQVMATAVRMAQSATTMMRGLDRGPYFHQEPLPGSAQERTEARGVEWRVIYEGASLREAGPDGWKLVGRTPGELARVAPRLPMKLLLSDDTQGLIGLSAGPGRGEAVLVRGSLLLDALIELFEQEWQGAIPVSRLAEGDDAFSDQDRQLLGMLSAGLTDPQISRNLGISPRTLQRRLSELQRTLRAESRFQLGVQASRQGLV